MCTTTAMRQLSVLMVVAVVHMEVAVVHMEAVKVGEETIMRKGMAKKQM
jgi:hypothetical protein